MSHHQSNQGGDMLSEYPIKEFRVLNWKSGPKLGWEIFGYRTFEGSDQFKAEEILNFNDRVSGVEHLTVSLKHLESLGHILNCNNEKLNDGSEVSTASLELSEAIQIFRERLFHDYLNLLSKPEFIADFFNIGNGRVIGSNCSNKGEV